MAQRGLNNGKTATAEAGVAHRIFGTTLYLGGDYVGARTSIEQALATYNHERDKHLAPRFGYDINVIAMFSLASVLWPLGEIDRATQFVGCARDLAVQSEHKPTVLVAHVYLSFLAALRRAPFEVVSHSKALLEVANTQGLPLWGAYSTFLIGWARCWDGEREGEAGMREGIARLREMNGHLWEIPFSILLAEVEGNTGRPEIGLATLDTQLNSIERTGLRWFEAEIQRVRGEIFLKREFPDLTAAEAALMRAIEIARSQRTRTFELRAAVSLAKLYNEEGRNQEANELLASAVAGFNERSELPDVAEAHRLLESPWRTAPESVGEKS